MPLVRTEDIREVDLMGTILVRYGEMGLKSEKVRSRFQRQLIDHMEEALSRKRLEHVISTERGRIFVECDDVNGAMEVLRRLPGIHSLSHVEKVPSEMDALMEGMSLFARDRLKEGMSFGIKVRRTGNTPYSSRDVAVRGGDAVCAHLDDSKVRVDLTDPDIWFEVEIRGRWAYLFTGRVPGIGGMPRSSQGKVLLFLPAFSELGMEREETIKRARLSKSMLERRGCRVIPASSREALDEWRPYLSLFREGDRDPFVLEEGIDVREALADACGKTSSFAVVWPGRLEDIGKMPIPHRTGAPVSVLQPTAVMDLGEVEQWLRRLES